MNELYSIMEQLLELDYEQEVYLLILKSLESSFDEEQTAYCKMLTSHTKSQLQAQNKLLKEQISRIDTFLSTRMR